GLAATLAWEVDGFSPQPRPDELPRPTPAAASTEAAPLDHTDDWVASILARPLFSPDRRTRADGPIASGAAPVGLPRLSGVLVGPFGRSAIFASDAGKPLIVAEGSRVAAWTVRTIAAGSVEIVGPGGSQTLHPAFENTRPATPQRVGLSLRQ